MIAEQRVCVPGRAGLGWPARLLARSVTAALLLSLAACRGCGGGPMTFEQLLGEWRFDVPAALKADEGFQGMAPDVQRREKEKLEILQRTMRVTYTKEALRITMVLSPEAAAKRRAAGTLKTAGRTKLLVQDRIVDHRAGEKGTLVLTLVGPDGDERRVHIRRIDKNHIEMIQPGSNAPSAFRFLERVR